MHSKRRAPCATAAPIARCRSHAAGLVGLEGEILLVPGKGECAYLAAGKRRALRRTGLERNLDVLGPPPQHRLGADRGLWGRRVRRQRGGTEPQALAPDFAEKHICRSPEARTEARPE